MIKAKLLILLCLASTFLDGQNRLLDSLKRTVWKLPADTIKAKTYIAISNKILSINASESKLYADSGLALSKKLNFKDGEGNSYVRLGLAYHSMSSYEVALDNFKEGLKVFISTKDEKKQGKVYNNIGYTHMAMANYKVAVENYLKAIEIGKRKKDSTGLASAFTNIAIIFALKGDLDLAEQYFHSAIEIFRKMKNEEMVNKNLLNLGGVLKDKGLYQKSIDQILLVQKYYEKKGIKGEIARCMYILGSNYEALKNYKLAQEQFEKALKIYEELNNLQQIAGCKLKLSQINNANNDFKLAIENAEEALDISKNSQARSTLFRSYEQMSEIYFKMKDFEKAYEFRLKYEALKDSIFNEESNLKINELEARYQNNVKKSEIKELQATNTINELNIKKQKGQKYVLIGFAILAIFVSFLVYNQYRIKKNSNIELQNKNQIIQVALGEKEVLLQEVHHRVKNNLQFVWSLLNMHTRHVKDKKALETLIEAKNRIKTMALIHQKLYQSDNIKGIDVKVFIPNLTQNLFSTYDSESSKIELETDVDQLVLDVDAAMPIALIINELVTNALKYAFNDLDQGKLVIRLKRNNDDLVLTVTDNGKGFDKEKEGDLDDSFGYKLIHSLVKQLKAEVKIESDNGVNVEVKINKFQFA